MNIMTRRNFSLGSEWLYCKIYSGEKSADNILTELVLPMSVSITNENLANLWFFIRYHDFSGFHIRLRFHMIDTMNFYKIIHTIESSFAELVANGVVQNIIYDTYKREIERYGDNIYEMAEKIFHIDSDAILRALSSMDNDDRWEIALLLIDDMLNAFELTLYDKHLLLLKCRDSFRKEFGFTDISLIRQLNDKYRKNKKVIYKTMERTICDNVLEILSNRKTEIESLAQKIKQNIDVDFNNYIASLIHMSMNRIFISDNRLCEMIIYDYLTRYYESMLAITKYSLKSEI